MDSPEQEVQEGRKKRTVLLMAGGAASLLLPLLGVVYLKLSESKTARSPNASVMFDRREGGEAKVNVSQAVTINAGIAAPAPGQSSLPVPGQAGMIPVGGGSSLDMVKGSNTYFQDKAAEAPKASTPTAAAAAAPAPEPEPEPKVAAKKGGPKPFVMPKLHGNKSITNNFNQKSPKPTGGQGMTGVADPQAGKGNANDMLKNIPGGIDNPEIQKLIQKNHK